jgi:histidinol-phosphatase (PHP family)
VIDYHVHLWRHKPNLSLQATVDQMAEYCEHAAGLGVTELAITEHTSRFVQFDALLRGWWETDPSPELQAATLKYWDEELGADLDQYVETALAARDAGLPVVIGMEVDYFPGQMEKTARLLQGYPFDVLLGSVHWIGAWLINAPDWGPIAEREWASRGVERVWDDYTRSVEELAATAAVDVLAHPDLVKISGHSPAVPDEFHDRIAEAARSSGLAAELNSAGLRRPGALEAYPGPPLLRKFRDLGVPITTASDGHDVDYVSWRIGDLTAMAQAAGYTEVTTFRGRSPRLQPL